MLVRVINDADSIFELVLFIHLFHDVASAAENEAALITYELLDFV